MLPWPARVFLHSSQLALHPQEWTLTNVHDLSVCVSSQRFTLLTRPLLHSISDWGCRSERRHWFHFRVDKLHMLLQILDALCDCLFRLNLFLKIFILIRSFVRSCALFVDRSPSMFPVLNTLKFLVSRRESSLRPHCICKSLHALQSPAVSSLSSAAVKTELTTPD